jgi:hypothetical protein
MADSTGRDLYVNPTNIQTHVGGKNAPFDKTYINNQLDLIKLNKRKAPPLNYNIYSNNNNNDNFYESDRSISDKYNLNTNTKNKSKVYDTNNNIKNALYSENDDVVNRYNPYIGYLYNQGLLYDGNSIRRFKYNFLNIDSRTRNMVPILTIDQTYRLKNNPLSFTENSNIIFINHSNSGYKNGSLITITGVTSTNITLKTFINNNSNDPSFFIPLNSNIIGITGVAHGIPISSIDYDVKIQLFGIIGDDVNTNGSFLGNIPINAINGIHNIYSTINTVISGTVPLWYDPTIYSANVFYIKLDFILTSLYNLTSYNYKILFQTLSGINLNLINAGYPLTYLSLQGFHTVTNVSDSGYNIILNEYSLNTQVGGGNNVNISLITNIDNGFPNPNKYSIILNKAYHDVISVKLKSIEFPNSERIITNESGKQNNKIYWNNIEDGNYLYSIEMLFGNYSPCELEKTLEELFYNTPRIYANQPTITYQPNQYFKVSINKNTDTVIFKSYKKFILSTPFIAPIISSNPNEVVQPIILTINNPGHGMTIIGATIIICGAIDYLGIPSSILNGHHVVTEIVDIDNYQIELPIINFTNNFINTQGGNSVIIYVPNIFRMLFNYSDTIGTVLGWRNVGNPNSITNFSISISNKDLYYQDINTDSVGNQIIITNNAIQLSGNNYVYMVVDPLITCHTTGLINNIFAKILLCEQPGKVIFNNFVDMTMVYDDPLYEITSLDIAFYNYDGTLYNFYGMEHSFTLEIITVNDIPSDTGISANTGKNYNNK